MKNTQKVPCSAEFSQEKRSMPNSKKKRIRHNHKQINEEPKLDISFNTKVICSAIWGILVGASDSTLTIILGALIIILLAIEE